MANLALNDCKSGDELYTYLVDVLNNSIDIDDVDIDVVNSLLDDIRLYDDGIDRERLMDIEDMIESIKNMKEVAESY